MSNNEWSGRGRSVTLVVVTGPADVSEVEAVDLAVVAYTDDGVWHVQDLPEHCLGSAGGIARELRRYPGGGIGMLTVDEDFLLIVRVQDDEVSALLSDVTVATDWALAASVMELLGLPVVETEDDEEQAPAGDLALLADLGVPPLAMGVLLDDYDLYPDEVLSAIARKAGFGRVFDDHVGLVDE